MPRNRTRHATKRRAIGRLADTAGDRPVATGGLLVMGLTAVMIIFNAAYRQPGPHPAPLFGRPASPLSVTGTAVPTSRPADGIRIVGHPDQDHALIAELQGLLLKRGYYEGTVDGVFGGQTEEAIRFYERAVGLTETGRPSRALAVHLKFAQTRVRTERPPAPVVSADAAARSGILSGSGGVRRVQQALADLGYGPIGVDGVAGPQTADAVRRFELDRGMPITGDIGDRLVKELLIIGGLSLD